MAISPRRSSRSARTSQPASVPHPHTQSSASSVSSGRPDRNARSHQKLPSPRSSAPARSQSADDLEDFEKPQTRRTRSTQDDQKDEAIAAMDDGIDEEGEEEVTRCICGKQEYPGLPLGSPDASKKSDPNSSTLSEDSTGWFIQCDNCQVWQHGGCVGIMDESTSPDQYFCEQCRKDLHKIMTNAEGRKYSLYMPVQESRFELSSPEPQNQKAREASRNKRDSRSARANTEVSGKGRRPTMNSRDSKYDEDEALLRALEESKKEAAAATSGTGTRKGKRSRSESEEAHTDNKRQRTISGSTTSKSKDRRHEGESEEEVEKEEKHKNIRGAAARNHRAKQERERGNTERTEASGKRKGRSDKRRGDDSDPSPEPPSRTTSSKGKTSTDNAFAPPPIPDLPAPKVSHKKTGRPPAKRGRVGRNQYTKDRDLPSTENLNGISPARSHNSQDGGSPHLNGNGHHYESNGVGKPSRPRPMHPIRTTMNDMKKRVAGILEFISHQQVEAAGLDPNSSTKTSTSTNSPPDAGANGNGVDLAKVTSNAMRDLDELDQEIFGSLNSKEMMAVLERRLMKWQQEYGKYGDK